MTSNRRTYQGWKGSYVDHYFGNLDKGTWINISWLKYIFLKLGGYTVRKIKGKDENIR